MDEGPVTTLSRALLGALPMLMIAFLPSPWLLAWGVVALLGLWLCVASLISYFGMRLQNSTTTMPHRAPIPLRFSGPTGRFALRACGDGRKVEIVAGSHIVAEVIAADLGDEIVLHADAVPDHELEELGSAIGQAIDIAATADEDGAASSVGVPRCFE
jgi:hypothetical protein